LPKLCQKAGSDAINDMLAAAAYNLQRAMNVLWIYIILLFVGQFFRRKPTIQKK
jgi:hypothetical protein